MSYQVKVLADAAMLGLPWMLIRAGRDTVLCVRESVFERAFLMRDVVEGSKLLPAPREPSD